ncbi:hypothetical protein LCGC14_2894870 [marine sediment metagenome]|uniref:DUF3298 domain-containing protein n=1 Tax=marine sediment metagenome TaxID=412755 RepID=A0A0F8XWI2_9ZZZZ
MGRKDLSLEPHNTKAKSPTCDSEYNAWWYEENGGVLVYIDAYPLMELKIPWSTLRNALKRKDSP